MFTSPEGLIFLLGVNFIMTTVFCVFRLFTRFLTQLLRDWCFGSTWVLYVSYQGTENTRVGEEQSDSRPRSCERSLRPHHRQWQQLFLSGLMAENCLPHTILCTDCALQSLKGWQWRSQLLFTGHTLTCTCIPRPGHDNHRPPCWALGWGLPQVHLQGVSYWRRKLL